MTSFGHSTKKLFYLSPELTHFNHGSFGTVPKDVKIAQDMFFQKAETYPDRWFKKDMFKHLYTSRVKVANLIQAKNVDDVVLVENASAAINATLRGLCATHLVCGDEILILSTAYNMVKEVLDWMISVRQIRVITVKVDFPIENENDILKSVGEALKKNSNIKVCVFSHITSIPAIILPIEGLVKLCKSSEQNPNSLVVIDGAHAPGLLDISVEDIGADFYTGNMHKWCYTPKGCAFLWAKTKHQSMETLAPPVIGSSGLRSFPDRYAYTGTKDYTAFACVPAALSFCEKLGGFGAIRKYNMNLVTCGAKICADRWGTSRIAPKSMLSTMVDVILPSKNEDDIRKMESTLDEKYNVCIKVELLQLSNDDSVFICRLSGQIYLEISDYERLADLVLSILH